MALIDSYNRTIDYLRVSVTDRCNFRCVYCMPECGASIAPKADLLTLDEIVRVVRIASELGMSKIRLTGGEPLVRKDIELLVREIAATPGVHDLSMTTNGFLLARYAAGFARDGLNRINISLDTLRPDRFVRLARRGSLAETLEGIDAAEQAGLTPIKLNCVVMRGWNDDEAADFARLTLARPFNIRFIELMPINWSRGDDSPGDLTPAALFPLTDNGRHGRNGITLYSNSELASFHSSIGIRHQAPESDQLDAVEMRRAFVMTSETRSRIESEFGALELTEIVTNGPARSFRIPGALGTIGFISQITKHMCESCNRLRLTSDGQLRPCLMADGELDIRAALRSGADDDTIAGLFRISVLHKPETHRLDDGAAPAGRSMSQIGG